jgi:hypothetical protein
MVLLISIIALSATAAEPNLKEIMQGLRDDVVEITDGLLTDDFTKVATSVHDLSLSIAAAADEKDRNKAIADYQRMLRGCFACHAAYKDRVGAVLSAAAGPE